MPCKNPNWFHNKDAEPDIGVNDENLGETNHSYFLILPTPQIIEENLPLHILILNVTESSAKSP